MFPTVDAGFDALAYRYAFVRETLRDVSVLGERRLWCAVIEQAFADMTMLPQSRAKEKEAAKRWLLRDTKDFIYVCMLAGVAPSVIRMAAEKRCRQK